MRNLIIYIIAISFLTLAIPVYAQTASVPNGVFGNVHMAQVGSGKYKKLGFNIYKVALWAPGGQYDKLKPYALQVHYLRSLSKDTVVGSVVEDVRDQKMADDSTMDEWENMLTKTLPAVEEGDEIVGLSLPGKPSKLFFNGKQIASIEDKRLSDSFFNIWLGEIANQDLRSQLLAGNQQLNALSIP